MKIGMIGSGELSALLGRYWARNHHRVVFGSRSSERGRAIAAHLGYSVGAGDYEAAARFGEVVFLGVPPDVAVATARGLRDALRGKILIDNNNPFPKGSADYPVLPAPSLAEQIAAAAPEARVVKACNVIGAEALQHVLRKERAVVDGHRTSIFLCGDDSEANHLVARLVDELHLDPVDCGELKWAHHLETMASLGMHLAEGKLGYRFAINVARERERSPLDGVM